MNPIALAASIVALAGFCALIGGVLWAIGKATNINTFADEEWP